MEKCVIFLEESGYHLLAISICSLIERTTFLLHLLGYLSPLFEPSSGPLIKHRTCIKVSRMIIRRNSKCVPDKSFIFYYFIFSITEYTEIANKIGFPLTILFCIAFLTKYFYQNSHLYIHATKEVCISLNFQCK